MSDMSHKDAAENAIRRFQGSDAPSTVLQLAVVQASLAIVDALENLGKSATTKPTKKKKAPAKKRAPKKAT